MEERIIYIKCDPYTWRDSFREELRTIKQAILFALAWTLLMIAFML